MTSTAWSRLIIVLLTLALRVGIAAVQAAEPPSPAAQAAEAPPGPAPAAAGTPTILITGTNRGVGLELARLYADRGWNVIATARDPDQASDLQAVAARHPNLVIEKLDVTSDEEVAALALKYKGRPIDVLLNNAGLLGEPAKQSVLQQLDYGTFADVMHVNVYAPLLLSQAFLDNVLAGDQKKIVAMTTAIASNTTATRYGGLVFYRLSKAGLNLGMRALQADLKPRGVKIGLIAPGEVDTHLLRESGSRGKAKQPAQSAAQVARLIDGLNDQEAKFMFFNGDVVPW